MKQHHEDCIALFYDAYTHRKGSKTMAGERRRFGTSRTCPCWCHQSDGQKGRAL
jgi:hypothetical protein